MPKVLRRGVLSLNWNKELLDALESTGNVLEMVGKSGELVRSAVQRLHLHFLTLFDILNPKMVLTCD